MHKAQRITIDSENDGEFTEILNNWVINNDLYSANQLRSIIYYHLRGIVKKQLNNKLQKNSKQSLVDQLPNTTSLMHDVLASLSPPKEIFDNREQFLVSLATFVRWMLLDDLKSKNALKRTLDEQPIAEFFQLSENPEPYLLFDDAFSKLEQLSPRSYQVAILHYFLGLDIRDIQFELSIEKSTVYNELSTAKAYLRTQC
ncbi:MAG: ECF-type sigma factor [Paraglaciecola sp.]|nr:ECF-type sigma factor [Paraglaciecola sp.]